jgi:hypothetical protein
MHGAGAAQTHPASVLGTVQPEQIAQIPEQRHSRIAIERLLASVDLELNHRELASEAMRTEREPLVRGPLRDWIVVCKIM